MKKGVPVSPGIAVARAYRLDEALACRVEGPLDDARLAAEVSRFDAACAAAAVELDSIIERVRKEVGEEEAAIFRAHRALLRDPSLTEKVKGYIQSRQVSACQALQLTLDEYTGLFARIADAYLRERLADVRDVIGRITAQIILQDQPLTVPNQEPVVLVAPEILPSQAAMFERLTVAGIATETG
jgi:phosphoenolpyruvate-protein kinase (PTS system EI component)